MTKQLIINADDYGASQKINEGIIECRNRGVISDMSLLAVGNSFQHGVELAKKNNIHKIGAHLALAGGFKPVSSPERLPTLTGKDKRFRKGYGTFLAKYFAGFINPDEIYTEFKSQISRVKKADFQITHLDSHQHIHVVPGILKIVARLMEEENIGFMRFPLEKIGIVSKLKEPHNGLRNFLLYTMCIISRKSLTQLGIKHNDYFIGHFHALNLRKEDFFSALISVKDGLTEFGCHPGYMQDSNEKSPFHKNRHHELQVLCDTDFANDIKKHSIELVSY